MLEVTLDGYPAAQGLEQRTARGVWRCEERCGARAAAATRRTAVVGTASIGLLVGALGHRLRSAEGADDAVHATAPPRPPPSSPGWRPASATCSSGISERRGRGRGQEHHRPGPGQGARPRPDRLDAHRRELHGRRRRSSARRPAPADPGRQPRRQRQPRRGRPAPSPAPPSAAAARRSRPPPTPSAKAVAKIVGDPSPACSTSRADGPRPTTRVIKGEAREAHAKVSVDLDIGGFLKLSGLRWDAFHRTGKDPKADGRLRPRHGRAARRADPARLAHADRERRSTRSSPPRASRSRSRRSSASRRRPTSSASRRCASSSRTPRSAQPLLGPVLNLSRVQREQLFDEIAKSYLRSCRRACSSADIGINVVVRHRLPHRRDRRRGGHHRRARAREPVRRPSRPWPCPRPPVRLPTLSSSCRACPVAGGTPGVVQPVADVGPLEDHCESAHPLQHTACSKGALLAVGLAGCSATAAVGALDWRHQRRRRARAEVAS